MTQNEFNERVLELIASVASNPVQGSNNRRKLWNEISDLRENLPVTEEPSA